MKIKIGDRLYIGNSFHLSRGSDDVSGGLATINEIKFNDKLPLDHCNYTMVGFKEVPGTLYNLNYLLENQEKWKIEFAGCEARLEPDIDRPWIEDGDIVDGEIYRGEDIW